MQCTPVLPIVKVTHQDFAVPLHNCPPLLQCSLIMQDLWDYKMCFRKDVIAESHYRPYLAVCNLCQQMENFSGHAHLRQAVSPVLSCPIVQFWKQRILLRQNPRRSGVGRVWDTLHMYVCLYQVRVGKCGKRMTLHKLG